MKKSSKKHLFDILSFFLIILMVISVLHQIYPLTNDSDITLAEIKNASIVPAMLLGLYIIIQIISGEIIVLTGTMQSLEGLPLILLILLIFVGIGYTISKDKTYFDFAKVIFGSFVGAFAQKKISSKKDNDV